MPAFSVPAFTVPGQFGAADARQLHAPPYWLRIERMCSLMSTLKRAVTSAACAIGLAAGAVALSAAPAHAATFNATYDCVDANGVLGPWNGIATTWTTSGSGSSTQVTVDTTFPTPEDLDVHQLWAVVNSVNVYNESPIDAFDTVSVGPATVGTLTGAPATFHLYVDNNGDGDANDVGDAHIICTKQ